MRCRLQHATNYQKVAMAAILDLRWNKWWFYEWGVSDRLDRHRICCSVRSLRILKSSETFWIVYKNIMIFSVTYLIFILRIELFNLTYWKNCIQQFYLFDIKLPKNNLITYHKIEHYFMYSTKSRHALRHSVLPLFQPRALTEQCVHGALI